MACTVHYDNYVDDDEELNQLSKEKHDKLLSAITSRLELGGGNLHETQSCQIPQQYVENLMVHDKCYKRFTCAISVARKSVPSTSKVSTRTRRSGDYGSTILPLHCMFCLKETPKTVNGRKQFVRKITLESAEERIRLAVELKSDDRLLSVIRGIDSLLAAEFQCHEKCQSDYVRCVPAKKKREKSESIVENVDGSVIGPKLLRKRQKIAGCLVDGEDDGTEKGMDFSQSSQESVPVSSIEISSFEEAPEPVNLIEKKANLHRYILENIIRDNNCVSMKTLTEIYGFDGNDKKKRYYVKKIIEADFPGKLIFISIVNEPQVVSRTDVQSSGDLFHSDCHDQILKQAAHILREKVDDFIVKEKERLVWPPTVKSLVDARERYPIALDAFFVNLLKPKLHKPGEKIERAAQSLSDDVVNSVSNGEVMTVKHTLVGCGFHSMTGLSKPIEILAAFNNSCTIDRVREVETAQAEIAQRFSNGDFPLPLYPMNSLAKVLCRIWYDNFDCKVENKEGSIHTTHGVCFLETSNETVERNDDDIQQERTRRRSLQAEVKELPEAKIVPHKLPPSFDDTKSGMYAKGDTFADCLPFIWKMQRHLNRENQNTSYRFVGWVTSTFASKEPKTVITFLPVIRNPITKYSTVLECLHQSLKYAKACNMKYVHVTADEGAAEKFYQVLWNNPIEFKRVIIHLGDFHGMMEHFGIIGKLVSASGFEDVLYQADLCTSGGINGVLSGKHYNRSWAVHECLSEALYRLFVEKEEEQFQMSEDLVDLIKGSKSNEKCKRLVESDEFCKLHEKFKGVRDEYLNGNRGKTAQFWMMYLNLIELQQRFHYSINVNDFTLRLECWKKIIQLCFPTNKKNYARYGAYYVRVLENLENTHPGAIEELSQKGISVRRNDIGIGQSIDGAGEQTFMRSAKTSGGIGCFMSNSAAYDKWVLCRPFQAKFVDALLHQVGLGEKDHKKKCLREGEIQKSEKRVLKLKDILTQTFINPFGDDVDSELLLNIASGSPVSSEVETCLLGVVKRGTELYREFTSRFDSNNENKLTFWDPIKKQEWHDFSASNKKTKVKNKNGKVVEVAVQRDILGFLLAKSQQLNAPIDMEKALRFPLSPVPLALAHADGERRKTNKSALFDHALSSSQPKVSMAGSGKKAYVLDLVAQLRSMSKVPDTFEELAIKIYSDIPTDYKTIYIACDTYRDISIKAHERKGRGESQKLLIRSDQVRTPADFQLFLCNGDNKERLFELIEETWIRKKEMLERRVIYFARGEVCQKITCDYVREVRTMKTNHEEADTKIAYLTQHALDNIEDLSHVCIRSTSGDIDITVIMVGAFGENSSTTQIFIDNGTGKNRKNIRIDSSELSDRERNALVAFHAMSGNDYVSSFMRKSKKVWRIVVDDEELLDFFCDLGVEELTEEMYVKAEVFVCRMYGHRRIKKVDELRAVMFWAKLRKSGKVPDLSSLPPCYSSLKKHTARAHHVAKIWKQATMPLQQIDAFEESGWFADGSVEWIDKAFPEEIESLFAEKKIEDDDGLEDVNEEEDDENIEEEEDVDEEDEDNHDPEH